MSRDRRQGLTLIALVGSVFSPYYARARRRGIADPLDHCALNVALYGERGKRWALTERGRSRLHRERDCIAIGPSALSWDGDALTVTIDEVTAPLPSRIRGQVRVWPSALVERSFELDAEGRHRWRPIAPCSRVEVALERPELRWTGAAYLDSNWGDEPLEEAFVDWHWSRTHLGDGSATILYDLRRRRSADELSLAIRCDPDGAVRELLPPPLARLPRTGWRVHRTTRSEGSGPRVLRTLEDTPFYARSLLASGADGEQTIIHESLSLDRFRQPWVQLLLPFRAPRRGRGGPGRA